MTIMCTLLAVISKRKNCYDYLETLQHLINFFNISNNYKADFTFLLKYRGLDLLSILRQLGKSPMLEIHNVLLGIFDILPINPHKLIEDDPEGILKLSLEWLSSEKPIFFKKSLMMLNTILEHQDRQALKILFRPHMHNIYMLARNKFSVRFKKQTLFETAMYNTKLIGSFIMIVSRMSFLFYEFLPSNFFSFKTSYSDEIRLFFTNNSPEKQHLENKLDIEVAPESNGIKTEKIEKQEIGIEFTGYIERIIQEGLSMSNIGKFFKLFTLSIIKGKYETIPVHGDLMEKMFQVLHPLLMSLLSHNLSAYFRTKSFFRLFDSYLFLFYCIFFKNNWNSSSQSYSFLENDQTPDEQTEMNQFNELFEKLQSKVECHFETFQFMCSFMFKDVRLTVLKPFNPIFKQIKIMIFFLLRNNKNNHL